MIHDLLISAVNTHAAREPPPKPHYCPHYCIFVIPRLLLLLLLLGLLAFGDPPFPPLFSSSSPGPKKPLRQSGMRTAGSLESGFRKRGDFLECAVFFSPHSGATTVRAALLLILSLFCLRRRCLFGLCGTGERSSLVAGTY